MFDYPDHTKNRISPSAGSTTVHIAQILKGKDTKNAKYGSKRKREYQEYPLWGILVITLEPIKCLKVLLIR